MLPDFCCLWQQYERNECKPVNSFHLALHFHVTLTLRLHQDMVPGLGRLLVQGCTLRLPLFFSQVVVCISIEPHSFYLPLHCPQSLLTQALGKIQVQAHAHVSRPEKASLPPHRPALELRQNTNEKQCVTVLMNRN